MTPELVALLVAIVGGIAVTRLVDGDARGTRIGGEAILFGLAVCAALTALTWSRWAVIAIALLLCGVRRPWRRFESAGTAGALHIVFDAIAALTIAGYAKFATAATPAEFDFLGEWGLKARVFFVARGFDWDFLEHALNRLVHPDYPPLVPLTFDYLELVRGEWNGAALGLVNVAFAAALLLIVRRVALEESGSSAAGAFVAAALAPLAAVPWIGTAEGAFVAYACAALLLIRGGSMPAGALLLGLAGSAKNEGVALLVAVAIGLVAARRARDVVRLWPAVAVLLPWWILRTAHSFANDLVAGNAVNRALARLRDPLPLLSAFFGTAFGRPWFWIALAAGAVIVARELWRDERFIVAAVAAQLAAYMAAYVVTPYDAATMMRGSAERLMAHLAPPLAYVVLIRLCVVVGSEHASASSDSRGGGVRRHCRGHVPAALRADALR
jgi:hypothetical protein